jgi:hypothetical protein
MARPRRIVPGPGRPSTYPEDLAQLVLAGMAAGETSIAVCRRIGLPDSTVGQWRADDRNGFRSKYVEAFAARAHGFAEEILQVLNDVPPGSDMATVTLARAKADALKWLASRLVPALAETTIHQHALSGQAEIRLYLPIKGSSNDGGYDGGQLIEGSVVTDESGSS